MAIRLAAAIRTICSISVAALIFAATPSFAQDEPVAFGDSDAEYIVILHYYRPGYWWDHTNLTVAIQTAPNVDAVMVQQIRDAVTTWNNVLASDFPYVSLTMESGSGQSSPQADIVIHYLPSAGGVQWSGNAICGANRCNNVLVRSDTPDKFDSGGPGDDALQLYRSTLHELGHALGLGHAFPVQETNDVMGYGWINDDPDSTPILSNCDVSALGAVFAWAVDGVDPHPPTQSQVDC